MSDTVALAIIGIVMLIVKEVFDERRARRIAEALKAEAVLTKADVKEVKLTLETATSTTNATLDHIVKQTNGMVKKLEDVAFARGAQSEKDKA